MYIRGIDYLSMYIRCTPHSVSTTLVLRNFALHIFLNLFNGLRRTTLVVTFAYIPFGSFWRLRTIPGSCGSGPWIALRMGVFT